MLKNFSYRDFLHQRLAYLKDWVRCADTYRCCMKIEKRVEIELFKERPVFYIIIFFYFLPINTLKFIDYIQRNYYYKKTNKEIEVLEKEIEISKLKKKNSFYFGKKR